MVADRRTRTVRRPAGVRAALVLASLGIAGALALSVMPNAPARAQGFFPFFDDRYPFQDNAPRRRQRQYSDDDRQDYSRAPAAKKPETAPTSNILVLGDAMADWLAYGLEDALSDTPELGVVRKHKTNSGLVRYEPRRDPPPDWAQSAKEIIAAEKPNFIVMMVGINDRQSIREIVPPRPAAKPATPGVPAGTTPPAPQEAAKPDARAEAPKADPRKPDQKAEAAAPDPSDPPDLNPQDAEQPVIVAPEPGRGRTATGGTYEFKTEKWDELYARKVDETIAALKTAGVPVYWVGLPALRGTRSTSDMSYLNDIFRARAEKAGIVFVDVWDGFIDEGGRFTMSGPDFEGQTRRLRSGDGVYFTKAGARKLAHFLEREIRRDMNRAVVPVAVPVQPEPQRPAVATAPAVPAGPPPRPLVGPAIPLTTIATGETDELLGGNTPRQASDSAGARILIKGDTAAPSVGRADDFAWPPRAPKTEIAGPLPSAPPYVPPRSVQTVQAPAAAPAASAALAPAAPAPRRSTPQYYPRPPSGWRAPPPSWNQGGMGFFGLFR